MNPRPRDSLHRRQPGPDRGGHGARGARGGFIAYNANAGLPFVPTYELKAELPSGAKLVKGNEVRIGGFRVGVVDDITPKVTTIDGAPRSVAVANLKLDKKIEPLVVDSTSASAAERSRSGQVHRAHTRHEQAQLDLRRGRSRCSPEPLEYEDLSTFDRGRAGHPDRHGGPATRAAGRGQSLNRAIAALNPFFRALTPVMQNLSDEETELDRFFLEIGRSAAQGGGRRPGRPVHRTWRTRSRRSLPHAVAPGDDREVAPTMSVSIQSFRVQRPFMTDFADLSRRLRPAAQELPARCRR